MVKEEEELTEDELEDVAGGVVELHKPVIKTPRPRNIFGKEDDEPNGPGVAIAQKK